MDLTKADNLARQLISLHLTGWKFSWNNRKRAFGLCNYSKRTIYLSAYLTVDESENDTEQTILHEIAHALAGPGTGHGPKWKIIARQLGVREAKATRKGAEIRTNKANPKWVMVYNNEIVVEYHRRPGTKTFNNVHHMYIRGRPETKGKLVIMSFEEFSLT